jgi:hypothetical protein
MEILRDAGVFAPPAAGETRRWVEQLRVASLSIGTYSVPVGGSDTQLPHGPPLPGKPSMTLVDRAVHALAARPLTDDEVELCHAYAPDSPPELRRPVLERVAAA